MPQDENVLGFSSRWYPETFRTALERTIDGQTIQYANPAAFLATKFEAFRDPHRDRANDYQMSNDFEDIIAVVDGRDDIPKFLAAASPELRAFVVAECKRVLDEPRHGDFIFGTLRTDAASQARLPLILERLRAIADIS